MLASIYGIAFDSTKNSFDLIDMPLEYEVKKTGPSKEIARGTAIFMNYLLY